MPAIRSQSAGRRRERCGSGFMIFPGFSGLLDLHLGWDLGWLPSGSAGLSTPGGNDFRTRATIDDLISCFFIAGPLGRYPEQGDNNGFSAAWLGRPPFDVREVMVWAAKAFTALKTFYRNKDPEVYRFFMIVGPQNAGVGGTALLNSFMLFVPTDAELAGDPGVTIVHEMTHYWNGEMNGKGVV